METIEVLILNLAELLQGGMSLGEDEEFVLHKALYV